MRKPLIAIAATIALLLVGLLVAAPKMTSNTPNVAKAGAGFDILDLTRTTRELPEQTYPTH